MNAPTELLAMNHPTSTTETQSVRAGFFDLKAFELIQRISKAFSTSDLVPDIYKDNIANCMIAMDMAQRIGANPLMVMQNLYIVHGAPGWSSKFLIATINASGRYSSLRYEWKGDSDEEDYGCRAWAIERETGERLDGIFVTWKMVRAEGWDSKKGSKWKSMPDQMFAYRAAAFWQRAYAPELGMGLQTIEDITDTLDATRRDDGKFRVDGLSVSGSNEKSDPQKIIPLLSQDSFSAKSESWRGIVESGKKSAHDLISMISTKTTLTENQRLEIESWEPANENA